MIGPLRNRAGRNISGLSGPTRALLLRGAAYWNGPAQVSDDLARLMAFADAHEARRVLAEAERKLQADLPVSAIDLTRVLLLTEIGISSTVLGPDEWHIVYGTGEDYDEFMRAQFAALLDAQDELSGHGVPRGIDPFHRGRRGVT